LGVRTLTTRLV